MTRLRWLRGACFAFLAMSGCSQDDVAERQGGNGGTRADRGGTTSTGAAGGSSGSPGAGGAGGNGAGTGGAAGTLSTGGAAGAAESAGAGVASGAAGMAGGGPLGGAPAGGAAGAPGGRGGTAGDAALGGMSGGGTAGAGMAGTAMAGAGTCPTVSDFTTFPTNDGPLDVGKLAVNDMKTHTGDEYGGAGYSLILTWYGALRFTQLTADTANNKTLIDAFAPYLDGTKTVPNTPTSTVDERVFGVLPLEIFLQNGDTQAKALGLARADMQWMATTPDGITKDARYWIDDMYMITGLQVAAYRATQYPDYLEHATLAMLAYIAALQQLDGLFWHTKDSHAYWGRANGWVAAGMTELLLELPAGMNRDEVMAAYVKQMDALLPQQVSGGGDDGCWRQVIDLASAPAESSCTAMFTYALATGVKNGWLTDAKYSSAARKGWLALAAKTDTSGKLDKICPGTGAAPAGDIASQQQFYAKIGLQKGDLHGQAPLLWSAYTLLRADCPGLR